MKEKNRKKTGIGIMLFGIFLGFIAWANTSIATWIYGLAIISVIIGLTILGMNNDPIKAKDVADDSQWETINETK
ncbi:MAG: hypothetical protein U1E54_01480, partial [Candidatus Levybacteria bacterium]|nr:hypothetical protein [Candidatus Levybacteria bacterium]